jgi:N-acyl-D-amino-acid deacylase
MNFMKNKALLLIIAGFLSFSVALSAQENEPFDLIITNGKIMDGTGNPWFYGDLAIRGDRIVEMGSLSHKEAKRVLDVKGSIVCPGFIDIHSHADDTYGRSNIRSDNPLLKAAHNMVMQGVTTLVVNHDGRSPESIASQRLQMESGGVGPNVALLVGHNSIRRRAMGEDYKRLATPMELGKMKAMITEGLEAGAYGLSAGLEYVPGRWSNTEELIELVGELKPWGGVYIVHERFSGSDPMWYLPSRDGQSPGNAIDNISEVIKIAEATGVPSCATHIKVKGADFWGASTTLINLVNRARARGVEVWADQYPYTTSGTDGNTVLIPDWALEKDGMNKKEALEYNLSIPGNREKFNADVLREIERRGGEENIVVFDHPVENYIGKSIAAISREINLPPVETAIHLQMTGDPDRDGGGRMRGFSMAEQDIELLAAQPWVITASDAGLGLPFSPVHARFYGTFPRKIAWYAKERGVITVEHAVRSATSLPAQFMGFRDRGLLREGNVADILVLDLDNIRDKATFFEPHQYPEGIEYVIVNGSFLVEQGKLLENTFPGKVLHNRDNRRNSRSKS